MTETNTLEYRNALSSATEEPESLVYGLTPTAWLKIAIVSVLMAATFRFNLVRLWLKTNPFSGEPNWRHAVCVPLIGLYYLYVNRDELLAIPARTAWSGLAILVFGILLFAYGIYPGQNDFVKDFGMVVALFGVVTLLCGWPVMKIAWFPIAFLVCAIPWPDLVYSIVASPLQHLAARVAVGALQFAGIAATNTGTKIIMQGGKDGMHALNVAEACAGLRSLMTFISVGGAVAFLSNRPFWQKILITASAVPIAVFCNVMRVTGQGFLDLKSHELSEGFAHQFVGIVMLVPGFFLILLVGWVLDKIFIEEAEERRYENKTSVRPNQPTKWSLPKTALATAVAGAGKAGGVAGAKPSTSQAKAAVFGPRTASLPKTTIPANSVAASNGAARPPAKPAVPQTVPGPVKKPAVSTAAPEPMTVNAATPARPAAVAAPKLAVKPVPPRAAPPQKPQRAPEAP